MVGTLVYESVLRADQIVPGLDEWGTMPTCFNKDRIGEFNCNCGLHCVKATIEEEPLSMERFILHTVRMVAP